jgi:PTS system nitrogen regulatory IIA component
MTNGDGMRLSDYLTRDRTMILKGDTKSAVLDELIGALAGYIEGVSRKQLTDAVNKREALMSTGIGLGIAVPHVRMEGVSDAFVTVGISREGIHDFESMDEQPVRIIVLIVAPHDRHDLYIKLLATVVSLLKESSLRSRITAAETPEEIYTALTGDRT